MENLEVYKPEQRDLSTITNDELFLILSKRILEDQRKTNEKVNHLVNENVVLKSEIDKTNIMAKAALDKSSFVSQNNGDGDYVGIKTIGELFNPPIKNKTADLMKWAGIVYWSNDQKRHVPTATALENKLAICRIIKDRFGEDRISYAYHLARTQKVINNKLLRSGLYEVYHTQKTKIERDHFINMLIKGHITNTIS